MCECYLTSKKTVCRCLCEEQHICALTGNSGNFMVIYQDYCVKEASGCNVVIILKIAGLVHGLEILSERI